jgi:methyl-accepting chemotaxis protein PixJ
MTTTSSKSPLNSEEVAPFPGRLSSKIWSKQNNPVQRSFWTSLRFKTTLLAVAIGTLPVFLVGTVGYRVADQIIRKQVEQREKANAELLADKVSRFMFERYGDIQILAQQPLFTDAQVRSNTTVAEKEQFLNSYVAAYDTVYSSIALLDKNGNDIAVSGGTTHSNHKNDDYFRRVMATGGLFISQPRTLSSTQTEQIYLAAPIKDSDTGQVIGVIRTRVPTSAIEELLKGFEAVGEFHFADASGKIFLSTEIAEMDEDEDAEDEEEDAGKDDKDDETEAEAERSVHIAKNADDLFPKLAQLRQTATSGSLLTIDALDQEEELLGYAVVPTVGRLPDLGWFVLVETELEEAFQAQESLRQSFVLGALLSTLAVGLIASLIANRGVKPIEATAAAVEQLGQRNFATRLTISGSDEVATLGTNINWMADQIQGLLAALKHNADRIQYQNDVLVRLAQDEAVIQGNAKAVAFSFTETIAHTLKIERVGIWLYNSDRSALACPSQYDLSLHRQTEGGVLRVEEVPQYFQRLESESVLMLDVVPEDSVTQELLAAERVSPGTRSILSMPIQIGSRTIGIIRCDQFDSRRVWQADEQTFLASIANLFAIVLESDYLQQEVNHLLDVVSEVEDGDLTAQARVSEGTIGLVSDTFNRLIEHFAQILNQVLDSARRVSAGAIQQKQLVETVTVNAYQQAEAVTHVLQLTEQVEQIAQDSAQNVQASSDSLRVTCTTVAEGQAVIDALTESITVLHEGSDRIMQRMKTLGEFVGLADQFVQDQSQIAFVTQTLAMNASLVAARASEQRDPRQFVVVAREFDSIADQVNKLAQQTSDGLTTIEQRSAQIHRVVSAVDADVQGLGELVRHFNQGVEQSNQVFNQVQAVMKTAVQVGETVTVSNEKIVTSARSTAQAIREIAELAVRNANLTQQTKMEFDQMDKLSSQLLQNIQFFQLSSVTQQDSSNFDIDDRFVSQADNRHDQAQAPEFTLLSD